MELKIGDKITWRVANTETGKFIGKYDIFENIIKSIDTDRNKVIFENGRAAPLKPVLAGIARGEYKYEPNFVKKDLIKTLIEE